MVVVIISSVQTVFRTENLKNSINPGLKVNVFDRGMQHSALILEYHSSCIYVKSYYHVLYHVPITNYFHS